MSQYDRANLDAKLDLDVKSGNPQPIPIPKAAADDDADDTMFEILELVSKRRDPNDRRRIQWLVRWYVQLPLPLPPNCLIRLMQEGYMGTDGLVA